MAAYFRIVCGTCRKGVLNKGIGKWIHADYLHHDHQVTGVVSVSLGEDAK